MKTSPDFLVALADRLGWVLLHSLWQGALVAVALAVALHLMRRLPAATRHAACLLAMMLLAAGVAGTAWHLHPPSTSAHEPRPLTAAVAHDGMQTEPAGKPQAPDSAPDFSTENARSRDRSSSAASGAALPSIRSWREKIEPVLPWISAMWMIGVAALTLRHFVGWHRLRVLRWSGVNARPALQRTFTRLLEKFGRTAGVRLLESADAAMPMLAGLFKPAVLLPLRVISGLREQEIEAILAHELAHLVRRDAWSNLAQVAIETLLFYHPAISWIGRCARQERENAADDLALEVCADRRVYAGALAQLAEMHLASNAALAANGGSLLARIRRIVRPAPVETPASGWSFGIPALLTALAVVAVFRTQADDVQPVVTARRPNAKELAQKAANDAKAWIADAFQLDDKAKREAAIERIRAAMTSGDADEARTGVTAFVQLGPIEFDKASFRPAVRALLGSADAPTRAAAASAITLAGADAEDIERILALADDPAPEVRRNLSWIIAQLHKNDLTGKGGDAVLKLLAGEERGQLREALRGIWGAKFSPALEARVIELSQKLEDTNGVAYDAMYYALSTQANKSEASVKRLIELLAHQDTGNVAGRCAWGLQQGVERAQFALLADAMVKVIEARSDGYLRNNALRCLRAYGNAAQAPALKAVLAKPDVTGDLRKTLEETLAALEARPVSGTEPVAVAAQADAPPAKTDEDKKKDDDARRVEKNRQAARLRAADDRQHYSAEQLQEIETLYQVANTKGKRSEEARASLKQLLEKYDKANRTGCATLYLGQASEGAERLEYLTRAVEKFSDCYYFNGCQVGGYGRYVLALTLWDKGEKDKARALLAELKTTYKDATDHRGRPMSEVAEAVAKELAGKE